VEHPSDIKDLLSRTGIIDKPKLNLLLRYAEAIHSENMKYNLTGHKTLVEIIDNLIIGSLEPIKNINVPRGTLFADIGTGAGIPGIPAAIKFNESEGILFDSNQKKIRFINKTAADLEISNVKAVDDRVEDACRLEKYRNQFDVVLTRAMSDIYTISELGAPLLKVGGLLVLFANKNQIDFNEYILNHLNDTGLSTDIIPGSLFSVPEEMTDLVILSKIKDTPDKYPRRMPVIKRMANK